MTPKIEFNDTGFKQVIKELAKMSGKTFDEVLKAEAGRVLQRIIKKTPASGVTQTRKVSLRDKAAAIKKNANRAFRFSSGESIYTHPQTHRRIFLDVSTFKGGTGETDSGYFYCPYVPLMTSNTVVDPTTYNNQLMVLTRYGKVTFTSNATSLGNSADYYGKIVVNNLTFL